MPADSVLGGEKPYYKDYFSCKFSGEGHEASEAESHFKDFELYYQAHKATSIADQLTLFRRTVAGKAKVWFDRTSFTTIEKLKTEFLKKFGKPKSQSAFVKDFYYSRLQDGEDIDSYAGRIKEAAAGLGISAQATIKDNFLRGLPAHIFNALVLHREKTLAELTQLAAEYLNFISDSRGSVGFESREAVNNITEQQHTGARDVLREEREMGLLRKIEELQERVDRMDRQGSRLDYQSDDSEIEDARFVRGRSHRGNYSNDRKTRHPSREDHSRGRHSHPGRRSHFHSKSPVYARQRSPEIPYGSRHRRYSRDGPRNRYSVPRDSSDDRHRSRSGDRRYDGRRSRTIICHRCGKPGHIARNCRTPLSDNVSVQDFH